MMQSCPGLPRSFRKDSQACIMSFPNKALIALLVWMVDHHYTILPDIYGRYSIDSLDSRCSSIDRRVSKPPLLTTSAVTDRLVPGDPLDSTELRMRWQLLA
nr:hypothetical protein CFP56_16209 [Quercus suber]